MCSGGGDGPPNKPPTSSDNDNEDYGMFNEVCADKSIETIYLDKNDHSDLCPHDMFKLQAESNYQAVMKDLQRSELDIEQRTANLIQEISDNEKEQLLKDAKPDGMSVEKKDATRMEANDFIEFDDINSSVIAQIVQPENVAEDSKKFTDSKIHDKRRMIIEEICVKVEEKSLDNSPTDHFESTAIEADNLSPRSVESSSHSTTSTSSGSSEYFESETAVDLVAANTNEESLSINTADSVTIATENDRLTAPNNNEAQIVLMEDISPVFLPQSDTHQVVNVASKYQNIQTSYVNKTNIDDHPNAHSTVSCFVNEIVTSDDEAYDNAAATGVSDDDDDDTEDIFIDIDIGPITPGEFLAKHNEYWRQVKRESLNQSEESKNARLASDFIFDHFSDEDEEEEPAGDVENRRTRFNLRTEEEKEKEITKIVDSALTIRDQAFEEINEATGHADDDNVVVDHPDESRSTLIERLMVTKSPLFDLTAEEVNRQFEAVQENQFNKITEVVHRAYATRDEYDGMEPPTKVVAPVDSTSTDNNGETVSNINRNEKHGITFYCESTEKLLVDNERFTPDFVEENDDVSSDIGNNRNILEDENGDEVDEEFTECYKNAPK